MAFLHRFSKGSLYFNYLNGHATASLDKPGYKKPCPPLLSTVLLYSTSTAMIQHNGGLSTQVLIQRGLFQQPPNRHAPQALTKTATEGPCNPLDFATSTNTHRKPRRSWLQEEYGLLLAVCGIPRIPHPLRHLLLRLPAVLRVALSCRQFRQGYLTRRRMTSVAISPDRPRKLRDL